VFVDRFARFKIDEPYDAARHDGHGLALSTPESSPTTHTRHISFSHPQGGGSGQSSRRTSFSEGPHGAHPEGRGSSTSSLHGLQNHWRGDDRRSSGERQHEPYRPMFQVPGEEIVGDAEGRKAYV
jgi:hypothetical protein